jgi:hypothetical protein
MLNWLNLIAGTRILGNVVSPVRKGADGKGARPVIRHCRCIRTYELRHKTFPRQPLTLPHSVVRPSGNRLMVFDSENW